MISTFSFVKLFLSFNIIFYENYIFDFKIEIKCLFYNNLCRLDFPPSKESAHNTVSQRKQFTLAKFQSHRKLIILFKNLSIPGRKD